MFITPEEMYGELGKIKSCHLHHKEADIYFLTKMKKVKFDISSKKIRKNGTIEVSVLLGDENGNFKIKKGVIEIIDFFYSMPHIQQSFENKNQFFFYMLDNEFLPKKKLNRFFFKLSKLLHSKNIIPVTSYFSILSYFYSDEVNIDYLSPYTLCINEPLAKLLTDEKRIAQQKVLYPDEHRTIEELNMKPYDDECLQDIDHSRLPNYYEKSLILTIDQIINILDIDVGMQEVMYIGQTVREPFERLLPHEKLQELTSRFLRNDGEALVIHMFGFQTFSNTLQFSQLSFNDKITTIEAELIKYFKPEMNDKYKNGNRERWKHIKALKKLGMEEIFLELDLDGQYCKFTSKAVQKTNPNQHIIRIGI